MSYNAPRGTHDLWADDARRIHELEDISRGVFNRYNFSEIRMPSFEDAALFTRSIGEATDIVEKEMYVFSDRKGRRLALRPEGTASVVRAWLEHQLAQTLPVGKLFYMGSMFRYERPQAGRYREFYQIGAEYFGNASPAADAEIMLLARDILAVAGLKGVKVHLNTLGCAECRPAFRQALKDYFAAKQDLCADCVRRREVNPLRLLDCKIDGARFTDLPRMEDFLCESCKNHFSEVNALLSAAGCDFQVDHRLVRGLDYYTRTVFEMRSSNVGSQDALAAGGRYDNLVKELGGSPTPSVGFALGSERVLLALQNQSGGSAPAKDPVIFVAAIGASMEKEAFKLVARLRMLPSGESPIVSLLGHAPADFTVEGPFADKSLKSQLRLADRLGARAAVIFGETEFLKGSVIVRDMKTQQQREVPLTSL